MIPRQQPRILDVLGVAGSVLVVAFWFSMIAPVNLDRLTRPYGVPVILTDLSLALVLSGIAGALGRRFWLVVTTVSVISLAVFLYAYSV
jgi:hypothetical protein